MYFNAPIDCILYMEHSDFINQGKNGKELVCRLKNHIINWNKMDEPVIGCTLGLGVCHQPHVNLGGFRSQLWVSHMSSHTEELWYNKTVSMWITLYIYIYIYIYIHTLNNYFIHQSFVQSFVDLCIYTIHIKDEIIRLANKIQLFFLLTKVKELILAKLALST